MDASTLLRAEDLAPIYGVTTPTFLGWARKGLIPSIRINRKTIRFDAVAVAVAVLATHRTGISQPGAGSRRDEAGRGYD